MLGDVAGLELETFDIFVLLSMLVVR
jgi:hypothetical protein